MLERNEIEALDTLAHVIQNSFHDSSWGPDELPGRFVLKQKPEVREKLVHLTSKATQSLRFDSIHK